MKEIRKTAECVSPAHPDKLCDQISDLILTKCLQGDPHSRVACETMGGHGRIWITGEITTQADVDYAACARQVLQDNRYNPDDYTIDVHIQVQSPDIARGVDSGGAGDQGIMVGYATNETTEMIPRELLLSRKILRDLRDLYPETRDAKAQVTTYQGKIHSIVVSAERLSNKLIQDYLEQHYGKETTFLINQAGPRDDGGFAADAGVTGRKLAVDNYGPQVEIGGGAFSGKDWSKVDRSAAYIARYIAKYYLQKHNFQWVKTKIAYCIGVAQPVMISIETNEGERTYDLDLDLTPAGIRDLFNLTALDYYQTAKRGHFGNGFVWDEDE